MSLYAKFSNKINENNNKIGEVFGPSPGGFVSWDYGDVKEVTPERLARLLAAAADGVHPFIECDENGNAI